MDESPDAYVWRALPEDREGQLVLDEREVERLSASVPDEAEHVRQILRKFYVQRS